MLVRIRIYEILLLISALNVAFSFLNGNGKLVQIPHQIPNRKSDVEKKVIFMSKGQTPTSFSIDDERNRLLSKASKLRQEVESLKSSLKDRKPSSVTPLPIEQPVHFSEVSNSAWVLTFRFSEDPIDDIVDNNSEQERPVLYSGKLGVNFRSDGFTDLVPQNGDQNMAKSTIKFQKVWGWDVENSNEDGLDYLMFSADAFLNDNDICDRFYFNAKVDDSSTSSGERDKKGIYLNDGIVTVKRDIQNRRWGLFNAVGILAQFRKVGYFSCKAIRI